MKKHYKFLLMTLFSLVLLGACSSGGNDIPEPTPEPDPDKVTVSPTSLTAEAQGGNLSLSITANKNWTAASDQGWCKLLKSSGASGTATIPITVEANTTDQERTAKITVTAGTASVTATVKQAKKEVVEEDNVTLDTSDFTVEATEKTVTISFTTNKSWTATSDQAWCKLSKSSGEAGKVSITATIEANTTDKERTAKITVKAGTASATATIKQAKKESEGGEQGGEEGGEEGESSNGSSVEDMQNKKW